MTYSYSFGGVNEALVVLANSLLQYGVPRAGKRPVIELPGPVMIEITNPRARCVLLKERKWNPILPFVESLWIALGWNDLDKLPGKYVKSLYNFSDDGQSWRAGYGPRIRAAFPEDYIAGPHTFMPFQTRVDQLKWVVDVLTADPNSRQAVIQVADPNKDCILGTKDQPCTRSIQFIINAGKLDCIVTMRSNDLLWGFSAVNVFNFTFMQEYLAMILDLPMGRYYHQTANLHFYEDTRAQIQAIADTVPSRSRALDAIKLDQFAESGAYNREPMPLVQFDSWITHIRTVEAMAFDLRFEDALGELNWIPKGFLKDWALVFIYHNHRRAVHPVDLPAFENPILTRLFSKEEK